jgi:hypothetical protein
MERGEREMIKLQFPSLQVKYDSLALTSLLLRRKGSFLRIDATEKHLPEGSVIMLRFKG